MGLRFDFSILRFVVFVVFVMQFEIASAQSHSPPAAGKAKRPVALKPVQARPAPKDSRSAWTFAALYSSANQVAYAGQTTLFGQPTSYAATEQTAGALGFSAGYIKEFGSGFGFESRLLYELPRRSSGISGMAGTYRITGVYEGEVSTSLLAAAIGMRYSLARWLSLSLGVNFPIILSEEYTKLQGLLRYQLGVGSAITEKWSIQLQYRLLRMKGEIAAPGLQLQIDEAKLPGFVVVVEYAL